MPETAAVTISEPGKKGIMESIYGLATLGGAFLKYFATPIKVAFGIYTGGFANAILGVLSTYSGLKGAINLYKSSLDENKDVSGSYVGRGLLYIGKALGTVGLGITEIPWLQGIISLGGGQERIRTNEYLGRDFQLIEYEAHRRATSEAESSSEVPATAR